MIDFQTIATSREAATQTWRYRIAIVIPVYNVKLYLGDCLRSVVDQSGFADCQVLVIDDGSTDGSLKLAQTFADRHSNVELLHATDTQGCGPARNLAMDRIDAEFTMFVDSDDELAPGACAHLLDRIVETGADLVIGRWVWKGNDGAPDSPPKPITWKKAQLTEGQNFRRLSRLAFRAATIWAKIYRSSLLVENGLRFPEEIVAGQDTPFTARVFQCARQVSVTSEVVYRRTCRADPDNPSETQQMSLRVLNDRLNATALVLRDWDLSDMPKTASILGKIEYWHRIIDGITNEQDAQDARQLVGTFIYRWSTRREREETIEPALSKLGYDRGIAELMGNSHPGVCSCPIQLIEGRSGKDASFDGECAAFGRITAECSDVMQSLSVRTRVDLMFTMATRLFSVADASFDHQGVSKLLDQLAADPAERVLIGPLHVWLRKHRLDLFEQLPFADLNLKQERPVGLHRSCQKQLEQKEAQLQEVKARLRSAKQKARQRNAVAEERDPAWRFHQKLLQSSSRWTLGRDYLRNFPAFLKLWKATKSDDHQP